MNLQEDLRRLVQAPTEDALDDFKQEHCLWLGFRAQPGGAVEEVAASLELLFGAEELSTEHDDKGLRICYAGQTEHVKPQRKYRQCYAELRAINRLLAQEYEIRLLKDSASEGVHCFLLARVADWRAAEDAGNVDAIFSSITDETDFKLGTFPTLIVAAAEAVVKWFVACLLSSNVGRRKRNDSLPPTS